MRPPRRPGGCPGAGGSDRRSSARRHGTHVLRPGTWSAGFGHAPRPDVAAGPAEHLALAVAEGEGQLGQPSAGAEVLDPIQLALELATTRTGDLLEAALGGVEALDHHVEGVGEL